MRCGSQGNNAQRKRHEVSGDCKVHGRTLSVVGVHKPAYCGDGDEHLVNIRAGRKAADGSVGLFLKQVSSVSHGTRRKRHSVPSLAVKKIFGI